jgi:GNAT superfamily N-acetyltransferase
VKYTYFDLESRGIVDLAPNCLVEPGMTGGWMICRVNVPVPSRRQGIARRLMAEVLADADAEDEVLWLAVNAYGDMTKRQLIAWYKRLGFRPVVPGWYRRTPEPPKSCAEICAGPSTDR